ncbi:uncharacterized protein PHALS_07962 [Plasmopara halstedii]|uniref:Uncharacterized protein n=1 Tax=Plasmopara halstedii TaxID=4781 RepID=A0A0P1B7D1_PLAHL|nr:uncharacterized protein PHALS_07962 [Plasmopara halstedii]CEG50238.1 hypothetical protein PHALS_07962 [Plasmopara halstedii]|eukprot:XP_024586607.1 hypothetical protein PHALS_07962 [Plasmopara halstedii]
MEDSHTSATITAILHEIPMHFEKTVIITLTKYLTSSVTRIPFLSKMTKMVAKSIEIPNHVFGRNI